MAKPSLKIFKTAANLPTKTLYTVVKPENDESSHPDLKIDKRYYLCSDDADFTSIYLDRGQSLPPSVTSPQKALFFGAHWAQAKSLSNWWLREEITTTTTTTRKINPIIVHN